jgi:hypothetical protein
VPEPPPPLLPPEEESVGAHELTKSNVADKIIAPRNDRFDFTLCIMANLTN